MAVVTEGGGVERCRQCEATDRVEEGLAREGLRGSYGNTRIVMGRSVITNRNLDKL